MSFDVERWWEDPHFQRLHTPAERGHFVLVKLMQRDPKRLPQLLADVCGVRGYPDRPDVITADQWRAILTAMGASPLDVAEIVRRIGIPLDT